MDTKLLSKIVLYFSMTILLAFLVGCSSTPSASDGKKVLADTIHQQSKGLIKLVSFNKTNGQSAEVMGTKQYSMEYDAEIEFLEDCYWGGFLGGFEAIKPNPGAFGEIANLMGGKRPAKKGQHEKIKGKIQFEKTEKGWRGQLAEN
jgi:hypothetical protein